MNQRTFVSCIVIAVAALGGCSSTKVVADWDRTADFSAYTSYAWLTQAENAPQQLPEHLDRRLRRVTDEVLETKGLERAPALPQADLLLAYYVSMATELRVDYSAHGFYGAYGYGYWPGYAGGSYFVRSYKTGTLVIDIVDRQTKQLVWTGVWTSAVRSSNPSGDRVQYVVEQLLADFPPTD